MTAFKTVLAGGIAVAALVSAAPASAQYYPQPGYGGGGIVGQVINQVLGGNQYGYGYGGNSQVMVDRCSAAVTQRINRDYGYRYGGYGGYGGYNNYAQGNARVLGITSVEPRSNGRLRVRGMASSNAYANYGGYGGYGGYNGYGGYAQQQPMGDLRFKCDIDYRGYITDIDLDRNSYGYNNYRRY